MCTGFVEYWSVCAVLVAQLLTMAAVLPGSAAAATPISPDSLGVNFTGSPPDLATASAAGVGLARDQVIEGTNTDAVVELTAAADLRLYPMLGLPKSQGAAADATAMAAFVTSFAQRYGPGGSFWAQHPELPYLPVESYEIGNEPDITPTEPADETSLHYANPADYAEVYEAARTALHQVDPTAQAVVGGMLDSGAITLDTAEQYLAAIGPMDAVGFHPYLYDVTTMEQDTTQLRQWLDANGDSNVPLDINEFGAADGVTPGIAAWGPEVAQYTEWALCTPGLNVENVQAVLVGRHPVGRYRPVVLDGRQRALRDSPRRRLPRGGPGADHAGLSGRSGFDPAGGDAPGDQPGGAHHQAKEKGPQRRQGGQGVFPPQAPSPAWAQGRISAQGSEALRQAAVIEERSRRPRKLSATAAAERIPVHEARCDCAGNSARSPGGG